MSRLQLSGASTADTLRSRSVQVILENQADTGAYFASPSLPAYRYSWFRDGAFIADAMSRVGEPESAGRFFGWCANVILERGDQIEKLVDRHRRREKIDRGEHLHCRYTVDGREVEGPWSNFQLDGYGAWLWALGEHVRRGGTDHAPYLEPARLTASYLLEFWAEPCFDWWEERWGRHAATLAAIYAGLAAAAEWGLADASSEAARVRVAVRAELEAARLDASLVACSTPFRAVAPDDPAMQEAVAGLEGSVAHGGVHRYPGDTYYGGGEWLLLAALLGWHYAETERTDEAWAQLEWVAAQATPGGDLPEQVASHVLDREELERWQRRWGPSACPLLWSHAWLLVLDAELGSSND